MTGWAFDHVFDAAFLAALGWSLGRRVLCRHGGLPEVYERPGAITVVIGA